jgi:PAS domain-containing protein
VARFTVDTRPEIGVWDAGSIYVDTNGNFDFDPTNLDFTNRDLIYTLGFTADDLFAGNFAGPGPDNVYGTADDDLADGFDKLAAYGRVGGQWRWLIDTDNDGVANLVTSGPEPASLNATPFAGNFDGNAQNGDEIGLFTGTAWLFDTNHDFRIDLASQVNTAITGYPVVGDFDGDGRDDLATYRDDQFFLDFAANGFGQLDAWFSFGFIGVRERPVAADMDKDGIDDLGLFVPDRSGATPQEVGEWYFLISAGRRIQDRIHPDTLNGQGNVVDFSPVPLGKDIHARFGNDYAMPIVGNFDPPVSASNPPVFFDVGLLPPPAPITVGLYDPGAAGFHLAGENAPAASQNSFGFPVSVPGGLPLVGDWDGDGIETPGVFDPSTTTFHLVDGNSDTPGPVSTFSWGVNLNGWLPMAGDWDGDGDDTVGLFDPFTTTFYLINNNDVNDPQPVPVFSWGVNLAGWRPVAGDWDGDGGDTVGVFDPFTASFYLINNNDKQNPMPVAPFSYHANVAGWWPVAGDWNGDGLDTIGLYGPPLNRFYLVNENRAPSPGLPLEVNQFDSSVPLAGAIPVAGRWTGPAPLLAVETGSVGQGVALSRSQLGAIVDAAVSRWSSAGLPADRVGALSRVNIVLADLPGRQLGLAARDAIYLDWDAAGHGWFVDPTPGADEEFAPAGPRGQLAALDPRAVDRIDLVSVVAHELGHVLGLEDRAADGGLMAGTLGTGVRRMPSSREVESALSVLDEQDG